MSVGTLSHPVKAVLGAFDKNLLTKAAVITGGVALTTAASKAVSGKVGAIGGNKWLSLGMTFVAAGVLYGAARKWAPRYAKDIFTGGVIAATTDVMRTVAPGTFGMNEWSEDLNMGGVNDYFDPRQASHPVMAGINDFTSVPEVEHARVLDGLSSAAENAIGEEIEMTSDW